MLPACGTIHAAGLCWPKRSIPDCMGHRTGECIHLRRSDGTFQVRRVVTFLIKSWRLIRYIVLVGLSVRESVVMTVVHPVTTTISTMSAISTMMYALRCQATILATSDDSAYYHSSRCPSTSNGAHLTSVRKNGIKLFWGVLAPSPPGGRALATSTFGASKAVHRKVCWLTCCARKDRRINTDLSFALVSELVLAAGPTDTCGLRCMARRNAGSTPIPKRDN